MADDTLLRLVNPGFSLEWNGKTYEVKKANLTKVVLYKERLAQYVADKQAGADQLLGAYALWLVLKDVEPALTEEFVKENTSGDADIMRLLETLGFLKPATASPVQKEATKEVQTTPGSSQP